jgi:hypothetical protein
MEPVKRIDSNTAILERHDYFETDTGPGGSIHGIGRLHEVTVNIPVEGDSTAKWKLNVNRRAGVAFLGPTACPPLPARIVLAADVRVRPRP